MSQDVSAYYDQTQNHYQRWWKLDKGMSLHYGLWHDDTKTFLEALDNTNRYMANLADIRAGQAVLDAGCGVGGAAIFLASEFSAAVTGLSLSESQIATARKNANKHEVTELVRFEVADYSSTGLTDNTFDIIWACESSSSAPDKNKMLAEWHRLLKPGGKLVLLDFFEEPGTSQEGKRLLKKWSDLWAMSPLITMDALKGLLNTKDFEILHQENLNDKVLPTIRWMYKSYLLGRIPAKIYNLFFKVRRYSRQHYKSGLYQHKTYKLGLWNYQALLARKSDLQHKKS